MLQCDVPPDSLELFKRYERQERMREAAMSYERTASLVQPAMAAGALKEVISKELRENPIAAEVFARKQPKGAYLSTPEATMAAAEWFQHSAKAQLSKFAGRAADHAAKADKIFEALQDYSGGIAKANPLQEDTDGEEHFIHGCPGVHIFVSSESY